MFKINSNLAIAVSISHALCYSFVTEWKLCKRAFLKSCKQMSLTTHSSISTTSFPSAVSNFPTYFSQKGMKAAVCTVKACRMPAGHASAWTDLFFFCLADGINEMHITEIIIVQSFHIAHVFLRYNLISVIPSNFYRTTPWPSVAMCRFFVD